jgi:hypothetical protein
MSGIYVDDIPILSRVPVVVFIVRFALAIYARESSY